MDGVQAFAESRVCNNREWYCDTGPRFALWGAMVPEGSSLDGETVTVRGPCLLQQGLSYTAQSAALVHPLPCASLPQSAYEAVIVLYLYMCISSLAQCKASASPALHLGERFCPTAEGPRMQRRSTAHLPVGGGSDGVFSFGNVGPHWTLLTGGASFRCYPCRQWTRGRRPPPPPP